MAVATWSLRLRPACSFPPGGPGLHAEPPEPDEAFGVLVPEPVSGLVGGQLVVVEAHVAAPAGHEAPAGDLAPQPYLAADEALALVDEGIHGLLEGGEPQAV